ncbi:MAG: 2-oxoacid:acceptor oxidoreductase subunit alpha [bacterium]
MREHSVLIGGQAGDGIRQVGSLAAHLLSSLGYRIYFWDDYPSLIRGGHNFSVIRAADRVIGAYTSDVGVLIALDQTTIKEHARQLRAGGLVVCDSDVVKAEEAGGTGRTGDRLVGVPMTGIVKEAGGKPIMRNIAALGATARAMGIDWETVRSVVAAEVKKAAETNLKIAELAYGRAGEPRLKVEPLAGAGSEGAGAAGPLPLMPGNEAIALGAVRAGLKLYISYPMTPSSSILHFLAQQEEELGIVTYHPENEIAVVVSAIGAAYAGVRTMVGTSGGGFGLMVEGVSLVAQNECPVVFLVSQRPGPSTGLPTYTAQSDLWFFLNAGHGEFVRFAVAPGDPDQAFRLAGLAMNLAWKYQIPAFIISDKNVSESTFSFESRGDEVRREEPPLWDGKGTYRRYARTPSGVSPLAFPGQKGAVVKVTSYEHDEYGITTEAADESARMQEKRLAKRKGLAEEVERMEAVVTYGDKASATALVTWGSTKGACREVAENLGLRVVQPLVMEPLPVGQVKRALAGATRVIAVENNATAGLARLLACHGIKVHGTILKYDGRPFAVDDLRRRVEEAMK